MRKIIVFVGLIVSLFGCGGQDPKVIKVGTISGPETAVVQAASAPLKQAGFTLVIKEFSDYLMPNLALNEGSLDANVYQHLPYLQESIKAKGLELTAVGKTFIYPMAAYSKKIHSLKELKPESTVAIPNDPSNEARALLLLQSANLIKVANGFNASVNDVTENKLNLQLKPMDAASLPRTLDDVSMAIINTTFAIPAGLNPETDHLLIEGKDSPYANLIVVRSKDTDSAKTLALIKALHSNAVRQKAKEQFGSGAIVAY